jgi:hypothetical protein
VAGLGVLFIVIAYACGTASHKTPVHEAGADAAITSDAGTRDAGVHDASLRDASRRDASARDAATNDAAALGTGDAGLVTGRACASAADCGSGYDCNTEVPGGYCLLGAAGGPMSCRLPEQACPAGTLCSPLPWHQISGVCLRRCGPSLPCRPGYFCGYVETFPGDPSSPRSTAPACWTECQPGADQSCNDNLEISSLHGHCERDATCTCHAGFARNPSTGRCL